LHHGYIYLTVSSKLNASFINTDLSIFHIFQVILYFTGEPDKPGKPEVKDWNRHQADLKWAPPKSDGGAQITSYIVEKKDQYR
jgi:hypothetical protein